MQALSHYQICLSKQIWLRVSLFDDQWSNDTMIQKSKKRWIGCSRNPSSLTITNRAISVILMWNLTESWNDWSYGHRIDMTMTAARFYITSSRRFCHRPHGLSSRTSLSSSDSSPPFSFGDDVSASPLLLVDMLYATKKHNVLMSQNLQFTQ